MPKSDRRPGDEVSQLIGFSSSLYGMLDCDYLWLMIGMLGEEFSTHLEREVPQEKYPTIPEWVQAVKHEVDDVLLPRARAEMDSPDYLEDLDLEERLDTMVDRAMRRLAQIKFMKQISATSEKASKSAPLLQIEGARKPKRATTKKE